MPVCNVLYTTKDKVNIKLKLYAALREGNLSKFTDGLTKYNFGRTQVRLIPEEGDSETDVIRSMRALDRDVQEILKRWDYENPTSQVFDTALQTIRDALNIIDNTQTETVEDDIEVKTQSEIADKNTTNLDKHLAEFYGLEAFDITSSLRQKFKDMITSVAYYNIDSRIINEQRDEVLNANIRAQKQKLFSEIVTYLKKTFPTDSKVQQLSDQMYYKEQYDEVEHFNSENYYKALTAFYDKVATAAHFQEDLRNAHIDRVSAVEQDNKTKKYQDLIRALQNDQSLVGTDGKNLFTKRMADKFHGEKQTLLATQLYTADHFSEYYIAVKNFINRNSQVAQKYSGMLADIEESSINLLDAANAYSMLTHFDGLLKDTCGNQIAILPGTANGELDISDKYSYHHDTTHQHKSWQNSEDIGAEKNTAAITKTIVESIRVYDYKTGEFLNRRVNCTSLIVATRNLLNAVLTGKAQFEISNSAGAKNTVEQLHNAVVRMHENPVIYLQNILELLFERQPNMQEALVNKLAKNQYISEYDLNILKSVYNVVFNKNDELSFFSQSMKMMKSNSVAVQNVLKEIAGYADRNVTVSYMETLFDYETGNTVVRAKRKFFNNRQQSQTQVKINTHVNGLSLQRRQAIQDAYQLKSAADDHGNTRYTVTIGGQDVSMLVPNRLKTQLLAKGTGKGPTIRFENAAEFFRKLEGINLVEFRTKIENNQELNNDEQSLRNVLQFIDDTLDLGILSNPSIGLQTLQSYKSLYSTMDNMRYYLQPLVKLAFRAAYANSMYLNAEDKNLADYLSEIGDPVYIAYSRDSRSKAFTKKFNNLKYVIASFSDEVIGLWVDAKSILYGEASKATTKDKQGNSIPNNSVAKLGSNLHYYLDKQRGETNVNPLLFVGNPNMIVNTYHDLEVTSMQDITKSIRSLSPGELFFHSIFNKFWGTYLSHGNVVIQPSVYSDKTTFLNWEIQTKLGDLNLVDASVEDIIQVYINTIGRTYTNIYNSTVDKLQRIVMQWAANSGIATSEDFRDTLHLMTEQDLVSTAARMGLEVELNKDYKLIKNKEGKTVVGVNELLAYNANLFTDPLALMQKLNQEKLIFLDQLLINNCTFQVITGNDNIRMYTKDSLDEKASKKNPIINTILRYFEGVAENGVERRKKFMKEWVDAATGRLILAKQGRTNIVSVSDNYDTTLAVELNPLLDKFFNLEGLLSNNLRLSLTGSEINHAPGKNSPFNTAISVQTVEEWNALPYGTLTVQDWVRLHNDEGTGLFDRILDIDDMNRSLASGEFSDSESLMTALTNLINASYNYSVNTSQGTQFKRNVIIPATLEYCLQNDKEGIPPKVKCAVIRDIGAPVFNYRGDHEGEIDSSDGNARITPFQCIMENRALGSQAVGFVKKPIWHSYDINSGTAFLAKFATSTLTNEEMRASIMSSTNLYNLFKKMTNLQWDPKDNIDLTKSLVAVQSFGGDNSTDIAGYNSWFKSVILGGKKLFYENKYGDRIEIIEFNKTVTQDGKTLYYTLEKPKIGKAVKKYHIFYDENGITSNHVTYDSYQQALRDINEGIGNPHTINSLFELHAALGGIYCVDENGNGSEYNNEVVVNFMNNVGDLKEGVSRKEAFIDQTTYNQPLKKYHIGYALNNTAVKNGAKNINPATSWSDNAELSYFEVDSDGLGMQMNADHDIVNAELTEFSQVIAATAAYGYTYDQCYEIFHGLARTAFQASEKVLSAVNGFLENIDTENRDSAASDLYDAVGRIIFLNQSIKDRENLTNVVMQAVQKVFNKNKNHKDDDSKVPYSDPNIFGDFVSTLASEITSQSIKRKHPGSGCVMVPGYNTIQYFEITDADGNITKLMAGSVLTRARAEYKEELQTFLRTIDGYDNTNNSDVLTWRGVDYYLSRMSLEELEKLAEKIDKTGSFSQYYTRKGENERGESGNIAINRHLIATYLNKRQLTVPIFDNNSYFMPSDIVEVLNAEGTVIDTVDLNSLDRYYAFKDGISSVGETYPEGCSYRISTTSPHNLRPSLIRWQYVDTDGIVKYMNYFDLPHVRDAYTLNLDTNSPAYRQRAQDSLHAIYSGDLTSVLGREHKIIEGTLENSEAELVMSNLYRDIFGIDNESLDQVLDKGEDFFRDKLKDLKAPSNFIYDVAFLRDNGKHTLITIGEVQESSDVRPVEISNTMTNEKDEIVVVNHGREIYEVGRWADIDGVQYNEETKKFEGSNDMPLDQDYYRKKNGKIQKRYDYVKKYTVRTVKTIKGIRTIQENVLYKIANVSTFKEALHTSKDEDAIKQQASIVRKLYTSSDYKMIEVNPIKRQSEGKWNALKNALVGAETSIIKNRNIDPAVRNLLEQQMEGQDWLTAKSQFLNNEAHKKWVSFQDSLKFISSRIPAQTLQSFMAMKLVGWTENNNNMAYVSHFQTYLQGSDYDIDKAYIMGQNYDSNSVYVKWSPYFDYASLKTLEASKTLPVPKGITIIQTENDIDLTVQIDTLLANSKVDTNLNRLTTDGLNENQKVIFINTLADIIRQVEKNNGHYSYHGTEHSNEDLGYVRATLVGHEGYNAPSNVAEAAYKNVASANIYAVSHDIRNRDQAYTAIAMTQPRQAAEISPKGEQVTHLNMLNPFAKYIMQYQNLVGKNVIGITANGEKFWFNFYFYCTQALKSGNAEDLKYMAFSTTLSRVKGRAKQEGTQENTVTHIPDLDTRDLLVKDRLINMFGATEESLEYKYVDQVISQLLSAATDNAKELILAKINANADFTKMYLYLISTGYSLDDIAMFMTCPTAEFIAGRAINNIFQEDGLNNKPNNAINAALGIVKSNSFLHGVLNEVSEEVEYGGDESGGGSKKNAVKNRLCRYLIRNSEVEKSVRGWLSLSEDYDIRSLDLDELMSGIIMTAVDGNFDIDIRSLFKNTQDSEIRSYARYCQDIITHLRNVKENYKGGTKEMLADAKEFKKIYDLSSEMSSIAVGYLGLNQGIPTDMVGLIKKINQMRRVVTDRERLFGIKGDKLFGEKTKQKDIDAQNVELARVVAALIDNNNTLDEATIRKALTDAYNMDIINNFDPIRALVDDNYKQVAKDYVHIIKGTANVIDMMDKLPHYKQIMECFKAHVTSVRSLAAKSRLVFALTANNINVDDQVIRGIVRYVDQLNVIDFLDTCPVISTAYSGIGSVMGFNSCFEAVPVDHFDLSTPEGIAGFKHFVETELLEYLKANHGSNPLVSHLTKVMSEGQTVLTTDTDLLHPNVTTASRLAYDDILRGIAAFEGVRFDVIDKDNSISIADLLQLYNLIVNSNQYGEERLTTIFKVCSDPKSILQKYLNFISSRDYDSAFTPEYNSIDYQINAAPLVSGASQRFHSDPFIKVKDSVLDYVIKRYESRTNSYSDYSLFPPLVDDTVDLTERNRRKINFMENYPFEMPNRTKDRTILKTISFDDDITNPEIRNAIESSIRNALRNLSFTGKILIFKDC